MRNDQYLRPGKLFFALTVLAIGIIHILTGNFPAGLMPVAISLAGRTLLVYITGSALGIAGLLMFSKKYIYYGTILAGIVFLVILLFFHLPRLATNLKDPGAWTPSMEIVALFSGTLVLIGVIPVHHEKKNLGNAWIVSGRWLFAITLIVFGVQHYQYATFISGLVPSWIPWPLFWVYAVMVGFFATAISLMFNKLIHLSATVLAFMFFLWIWTLHIPRVIGDSRSEPEWTSLFIDIAMCGISLLIAGSATDKQHQEAGDPLSEQ